MRIFWQFGYASTSIQRLSNQLALHPGSLYGAFKNKRQLFMEALEFYFERSSQSIREAPASGELAKDKDPAALACFLLVGVRGLRVYGRTRPSRKALEGAGGRGGTSALCLAALIVRGQP